MITRVLIKPGGMQESQRQGRRVMMGAECGGMGGREPRNAGSLLEQERPRNQILPQSLQMDAALRPIVDFDVQNCQRINLQGFKPLHV